jgi:hypothetical protein
MQGAYGRTARNPDIPHGNSLSREKEMPDGKGLEKPAADGALARGSAEPPVHGGLATPEAIVASLEITRVASSPTVQERGQRSTAKLFRSVLDLYPMKFLHTNERIGGKAQAWCLRTKEDVKIEDADNKDGRHHAMEKPAKEKTVTWKIEGTTKAMSTMMAKTVKAIPRVTPTQSKWRI